jgi:hypothetical protein
MLLEFLNHTLNTSERKECVKKTFIILKSSYLEIFEFLYPEWKFQYLFTITRLINNIYRKRALSSKREKNRIINFLNIPKQSFGRMTIYV